MRLATIILLALLFMLGLLYLGAELYFSVTRDRSEFDWLEHTMRFSHIVFTLPLLFIPIVQFSKRLRHNHPGFHRALGRMYLVSAMLAAVGALYLGLTFDDPGRRIPLVLFAVLWFYFSATAWQAARNRNFQTHAKFVVRSYGIALAFILVRILSQLDPILLAWIPEVEVRDVTREWLAFIIPLLLIEITISWIPSIRTARNRPASLNRAYS